MHFSSQLLLAAGAVTASPLAWHPISNETFKAPTLPHPDGHNFSVHQIPNPDFNSTKDHMTGPLAHAKAILKFGGILHEDLEAAISAASNDLHARGKTGSVASNPLSYDSEYLSPVSIGTPAQTLNLDFDTGSSDLWVFSSETPQTQVKGQSIYNIGKSRSAVKVPGQTWSIKYADGSGSSGDVYYDTVNVGGVSVARQAVESAQSVSSAFTANARSSGLLGLAFSSINTVKPTQQKTWFDNAKSLLSQQLFTANLKKGAAGTYNFGFIDTTEYTGAINYAPVKTGKGYWEFLGSGYQFGTNAFTRIAIDAVADTGSTLMLMPNSVVSAYWKQVKGATYSSSYGAYVFPCSSALPSITFGVGNGRQVVPGSYLNYAQYTSTTCYGGLQSNGNLGFSILGDIFLKSQFAVFDAGNTRIGFANKAV